MLRTFEGSRLKIDRTALCAEFGGVAVKLSPRSCEILQLLAGRPGELLSRRQLALAIWGTEAVTDGAISQAISQLRLELGQSHLCVRTVPRRGYVFEPDALQSEPATLPFATDRPAPAEAVLSDVAISVAAVPDAPSPSRTQRRMRVPWQGAVAVLLIVLLVFAVVASRWQSPALLPVSLGWLDIDPRLELASHRAILHALRELRVAEESLSTVARPRITPADAADTLELWLPAASSAILIRDVDVPGALPQHFRAWLAHQGIANTQVAAVADAASAESLLNAAREQKQQGEWAAAVEIFMQSIAAAPDRSDIVHELADLLLDRGSARAARLWAGFLLASEIDPLDPTRARAIVAGSLENHLDRYLELGRLPDTPALQIERVQSLLRAGEPDRAEALFRRIAPSSEPGLALKQVLLRGQIARARHDYLGAAEIFAQCMAQQRAAGSAEHEGVCMAQLGLANYLEGRIDEARLHQQRAIQLIRNEADQRFDAMLTLLFLDQQPDAACADLRRRSKELRLQSQRLGDPYSLGAALMVSGQIEGGCRDLDAAASMMRRAFDYAQTASSPRLFAGTGLVLVEIETDLGNAERAQEILDRIRGTPNTLLSQAMFNRVQAYDRVRFSRPESAPADRGESACWNFLLEDRRPEQRRLAQNCVEYWGEEAGWDANTDQTLAKMMSDPTELHRVCSELRAQSQNYHYVRFGSRGFRLRAACGGAEELAAITRMSESKP